MDILKIFGKIGAGALGLGALVLAGKSGFGEKLLSGKDEVDTDDLEQELTPIEPTETTETVDTTAEEEDSE